MPQQGLAVLGCDRTGQPGAEAAAVQHAPPDTAGLQWLPVTPGLLSPPLEAAQSPSERAKRSTSALNIPLLSFWQHLFCNSSRGLLACPCSRLKLSIDIWIGYLCHTCLQHIVEELHMSSIGHRLLKPGLKSSHT